MAILKNDQNGNFVIEFDIPLFMDTETEESIYELNLRELDLNTIQKTALEIFEIELEDFDDLLCFTIDSIEFDFQNVYEFVELFENQLKIEILDEDLFDIKLYCCPFCERFTPVEFYRKYHYCAFCNSRFEIKF